MRISGFVLVALFALASAANVVVKIGDGLLGPRISDYFVGLSYEESTLIPNGDGKSLWGGDGNDAFPRMLSTIGIRSLRIGGNSADRMTPPSTQLWQQMAEFGLGTHCAIIPTLGALHPNVSAAIDASRVLQNYPNVFCVAVGNEPDLFPLKFDEWYDEYQLYSQAIGEAGIGVDFCGPAAASNTSWPVLFAERERGVSNVSLITAHLYPGGNGKTTDPERGREYLLSKEILEHYATFADRWVPDVVKNGFRFHLDETNSFYDGGAPGVSNTFAAALWGLDYMYWWAMLGADGLNFHVGGPPHGGPYDAINPPAWATSYTARPLAYGILAFSSVATGSNCVDVNISNPSNVNITVYGVKGASGTLAITVINKELGPSAQAVSVSVHAPVQFNTGKMARLTAPDVSSTSGVEFGGASIQDDGSWDGSFAAVTSSAPGVWDVDVDATSAFVLVLSVTSQL